MIGLICVARAHRTDPRSQGRVTKQDGLWCFCPADTVSRPHEWQAVTPAVPLSDIAMGRFRGVGTSLRTPWPILSAGKKSSRQSWRPVISRQRWSGPFIYRSLTRKSPKPA